MLYFCHYIYRILVVFIILILSSQVSLTAQLRLDTSSSPEQLVRKSLLGSESGLIIKNVQFSGLKQSIGSFYNETALDIINEGLILSTGDIFDAIGPNRSKSTGSPSSGRRDNDLQAIATGVVLDAVVLEFDLIALKDSIEFEYVFASDEYPEFVNKGVSDIFGFFLTEVGARALFAENLAIVPNSRKPVSINNINHRVNEQYFLRSDFLTAHDAEFWKEHPDLFLRARFFEYDGFTTVLKATAKLKEGRLYHLKFALADVGDRLYDSAVLLKAKSFSSKGKLIAKADSIVKREIDLKLKEFSNSYTTNKNQSFSLKINFNSNESVILKESFFEINQLAELLQEFQDLKLNIIGHTDDVGSNESNLKLSKKRAIAVKKYLFDRSIKSKRLTTDGKGETQPKESNATVKGKAENRRVEFRFSY
ncbi:MAG: OmpA family protein [Flavobacteriales bacterium]|nr:OmpA family protein [Flavobacteriales bacterium]